MAVVTQAEFARLTNAGRSTVAGWIEKGTISGDALVRRSGKMLVDAEKALRQVQLRRDIGQALGNGFHIRTGPAKPRPVARMPLTTPIEAEAAMQEEEADPLWSLAIENAKDAASEFEAGMIAMFVLLAHQIGAVGAMMALMEGAPLPLAYGIEKATTVGFMSLDDQVLRGLPTFAGHPADQDLPLIYASELMLRVDWEQMAAHRGEPAAIADWDAARSARITAS